MVRENMKQAKEKVMKAKTLVIATVALIATILFPAYSLSQDSSPKSDVVTVSADNLLVLNSEINGDSTGAIIEQARKLDEDLSGGINRLRVGADERHIYLFLKTPGGEIEPGQAMLEALKGLKHKVDTITLFAASMGFQTVQNLGERLILSNGTMMSHQASGGVEGQFGGLRGGQLDQRYAFYLQSLKEMDEITVRRTNGKQTLESYQKSYDHEMWRTGAQSVAEGYSDRVITLHCDSSLSGTTSHEADVLFFHIVYELSNCPINQSPMNVKVIIPALEKITGKQIMTVLEKFTVEGGVFAQDCSKSTAPLCSQTPAITPDKVKEIKDIFLKQYETKTHNVLPMVMKQ